MTLVARRRQCAICKLPDEAYHAVNHAIWGGGTDRRRGYQSLAMAAAEDYGHKDTFKRWTVINHADHIEKDRRVPTERRPATIDEDPVYATDYLSVADRAAALGVKAMRKLEERVDGDMDSKDLVSLAKLGVSTRSAQEDRKLAARGQDIAVAGLFGFTSGHFAQLPEHEVIDVTPESELREEFSRERRRLEAHAGR